MEYSKELQDLINAVNDGPKFNDKTVSFVDKFRPTQMLYNYCMANNLNFYTIREEACGVRTVGEYGTL